MLFHLNGHTKVMVERTEGVGLADGGIVWEMPTEIIPAHLRQIGSRFLVEYTLVSPEEMKDVESMRELKNRVEILELS